MPSLNDHEIAAFDLGHDAREGGVDQRVEGGIADYVMGDVDLEAFVRGDRRCKGVDDVGEGRESTRAKFAA